MATTLVAVEEAAGSWLKERTREELKHHLLYSVQRKPSKISNVVSIHYNTSPSQYSISRQHSHNVSTISTTMHYFTLSFGVYNNTKLKSPVAVSRILGGRESEPHQPRPLPHIQSVPTENSEEEV